MLLALAPSQQPQRGGTPLTPTARSLDYLRRLGFVADVCERWLPHAGVRRDLFGFADIAAVHPRDRLILLVQATTAAHVAHRLGKAKARPELLAWLKAGGVFEVHGWAMRGRGWQVRRVALNADDLATVTLEAPRHRRPRKGARQRELFTTGPASKIAIVEEPSNVEIGQPPPAEETHD